ncbi:MAG: hypothetical protein CLLPBCKN_008193 [Chroococcidiopsis cubana SAG 39.79]|nr:hypothetical protein [Chroococcidiopsis cubana SAG 39.79]
MATVSLLGTIDGLTFEAFVARKLVPKLWAGACVIMDNCSIHKAKEIEAMIQTAGARLIHLPLTHLTFPRLKIVGRRSKICCVRWLLEVIQI